jgi:hypothetical protein
MTQIEYLKKNYKEKMPAWLGSYSKGQPKPLNAFLQSRIVYYPGAAWDWHPIELFAGSESAHCFIYVDYLQPEELVIGNLQGEYGLDNYQVLDSVQISESELRSASPWKRHFLNHEELKHATEGTSDFRGVGAPSPYARLVILERKKECIEGANRIAILFLGADGHATFEAVFANNNANDLFGFVLQEHGFGGNYDRWGRGGLCEKIMLRSSVFPKVVLSEDENWVYDGYEKIENLQFSGVRLRDIYVRREM